MLKFRVQRDRMMFSDNFIHTIMRNLQAKYPGRLVRVEGNSITVTNRGTRPIKTNVRGS